MNQISVATPLFEQSEAERFAEDVADKINGAGIIVMLALGHRTGLFDTMAGMPPRSAAEIAEAAGLAERYVREWLAAMVTGGVVRYDPERRHYHLPAEHAACLTRGAPLGNYCVTAQMVPALALAQDRILECFETGEGTHYEDYPHFHSMMEEDSAQTVVAQLFDTILPLAPGLTDRLVSGIDVLDAGCGSGRALIALAERFPASRFTGYDLCEEAIARARRAAKAAGIANASFASRDLTGFDEAERYDLVLSFDAVHDQKEPQTLLDGLHRALRPGGTYLMQDIGGSAHLENNIDFPMAAFAYTISCHHCMPISLGQGGQGLGTMWGWETAQAMLTRAGFVDIERHVLPHDPLNVWFVTHKR
jgi:SAM-dependent methyltransferase